MADSINGVSSQAVAKATGKNWDQWIKIIEDSPMADQPHKDIAKWLGKDYQLTPWWCQMVTVGYEFATGKRVLGETADQGFEVGVHKTIPAPAALVWDFMLSAQGLAIWLGKLPALKLEKGFVYQTADGAKGEVRTWQDQEFIRMIYQPKSRTKPTTLQIRTASTGPDKTRMSFHHEKLAGANEREEMRARWRKVLDELAKAIVG